MNSANDALAMIEELFRAGDNDGSGDIDPVELSKLVVQIFEKLRKPIPHDFRCDLEGVIRKAMQRFDVDNSGTIHPSLWTTQALSTLAFGQLRHYPP